MPTKRRASTSTDDSAPITTRKAKKPKPVDYNQVMVQFLASVVYYGSLKLQVSIFSFAMEILIFTSWNLVLYNKLIIYTIVYMPCHQGSVV